MPNVKRPSDNTSSEKSSSLTRSDHAGRPGRSPSPTAAATSPKRPPSRRRTDRAAGLLRQVRPTRPRRPAAHRNMRVLRDPQRSEPPLVDRNRQTIRTNRQVGREDQNAKLHDRSLADNPPG